MSRRKNEKVLGAKVPGPIAPLESYVKGKHVSSPGFSKLLSVFSSDSEIIAK